MRGLTGGKMAVLFGILTEWLAGVFVIEGPFLHSAHQLALDVSYRLQFAHSPRLSARHRVGDKLTWLGMYLFDRVSV